MGLLVCSLLIWSVAATTLALRELETRIAVRSAQLVQNRPWLATVLALWYALLPIALGTYEFSVGANPNIATAMLVTGLAILLAHRKVRSKILQYASFGASHPGYWRTQYTILALSLFALGFVPLALMIVYH